MLQSTSTTRIVKQNQKFNQNLQKVHKEEQKRFLRTIVSPNKLRHDHSIQIGFQRWPQYWQYRLNKSLISSAIPLRNLVYLTITLWDLKCLANLYSHVIRSAKAIIHRCSTNRNQYQRIVLSAPGHITNLTT